MFKVVETIENGEKHYSAVPSNWEQNSDLFWPAHLKVSQRDKLRKDELSNPGDNWIRIHCKIKGFADTYIEALKLERLYVSFTDTEAEETYAQRPNTQKRYIKKTSQTTEVKDYNIMLESLPDEVQEEIIIPSIKENDNTIVMEEYCSVPSDNVIDITSFCTQILNELSEIKNEVKDIKQRQNNFEETVISQFAQIQVKLDKVLKMHGDATGNGYQADLNLTKDLRFPLTVMEELLALDQQLGDKDFKEELVNRLSTIGGTSKTSDGVKIMFKLIDYLFDPMLLNKFSWTGSSKSKEKKECFQKLSNIVDIIYEVVFLADCRHSRSRNEEYLKEKILKHTGQRLKRKRTSALCQTPKDQESMQSN